jgi:hypothetical protein
VIAEALSPGGLSLPPEILIGSRAVVVILARHVVARLLEKCASICGNRERAGPKALCCAPAGGPALQRAEIRSRRPRNLRDITVYGDGSQTRSFCYVDDLVDGLVRFMQTSDDVTGSVNLGNPIEFTIRELAEKTIVLTGSSKIIHQPLPLMIPSSDSHTSAGRRSCWDGNPKSSSKKDC